MSTLAHQREEYNGSMAQEINLGGTIYISSKHAAEKTGYTQDYIGQLARGGQIEAKRVSGMWYILEESLRAYKEKADQFVPTPPEGFTKSPNAEVAVSFDGKDYISANRAAKLTGYNQDYIGQLARSNQILSRQVGKRWYVDRESLLKHKEEKDALLAAVQVESVGLARPEDLQPVPETAPAPVEEAVAAEEVTHFSYVKEEEVPLIPEFESEEPEPMPEFPRRKVAEPVFEEYRIAEKPEPVSFEAVESISDAPDIVPEPVVETVPEPPDPEPLPEMNIPIRVLPREEEIEEVYIEEDAPRPARRPVSAFNFVAISSLTVVAALGTLAYIGSSLGFLDFSRIMPKGEVAQNASAANPVVESSSSKAEEFVRGLFSKEITYKRQ
jgi:hypothetical protein